MKFLFPFFYFSTHGFYILCAYLLVCLFLGGMWLHAWQKWRQYFKNQIAHE